MIIKIIGDFNTNDLKVFARALRKIEQQKPDKIYTMILKTPDMSVEEASKLITRIYASTLEKKKQKCKNCGHPIQKSPNEKAWGRKWIHTQSMGLTPALHCNCGCKEADVKK